MKKIFWPIAMAVILTALVFNAAYYGFNMAADDAYLIVAAAAAAVAVAFVAAAAAVAAAFVAAAAAAAVFVAAAAVAVAAVTAVAVFVAVAFAAVAAVTAVAVAVATGAKDKVLSFARVLAAYLIEGAVVFFVLMVAPSDLLASTVIAAGGVGAVWFICFLSCPRFFLRRKQAEDEPRPVA